MHVCRRVRTYVRMHVYMYPMCGFYNTISPVMCYFLYFDISNDILRVL